MYIVDTKCIKLLTETHKHTKTDIMCFGLICHFPMPHRTEVKSFDCSVLILILSRGCRGIYMVLSEFPLRTMNLTFHLQP